LKHFTGSGMPAKRAKSYTPNTRYNEFEGTNNFVLYRGVLLLQGLFTMKLITKGLGTKFVIAGISLLKGSLLRGFNVHGSFVDALKR
jgi:hypothetical protein